MKRSGLIALALVTGCATSAYQRAGSSDDVASALAKSAPVASRPANAAGKPLVFLALGGVKGPRLAAYDLAAERVLWTQPANLKARVEVGADVVVYGASDALEARDITSGAQRWSHAFARDERLLGYTIDGAMVYLTLQKGGAHLHGGVASVVALDAATGVHRWSHEMQSGDVGAPAARGGLVAVPVQSQYVTLLDGRSGDQLAQVLSSEEAATFVRALPEGLFFGSHGVFRLSPATAGGSRKSDGYARATLPAFVRPVYWFDLYRPEQGDYSALDRNRILWRMTASDAGGAARFRDDLTFVHNYRFFFGFDARTGALRWAYNHPMSEAVASADVGDAIAFVTADGDVGALDTRTGRRVFEAHLPGEIVRGATFDAEGWTPRGGTAGGAPSLSETLSTIVWDLDRRFWDVKMFAIEELARQPGREVTLQLLKITEQEGLPPAVYQKAGEALIARKDATSGDLLAQVLEAHADYADGHTAPAVEILARAAGAMKATAAVPALIAHLRRPETPPAAATQIARALAAIGATEALPALRDFVTMYRADPAYDGDPTPLVAASEAMLDPRRPGRARAAAVPRGGAAHGRAAARAPAARAHADGGRGRRVGCGGRVTEPRRLTVMVCRGPTCGERRNSGELYARLEALVAARGLAGQVTLGWETCFGHCIRGPNVLVYDTDEVRGWQVYAGFESASAVLYNRVTLDRARAHAGQAPREARMRILRRRVNGTACGRAEKRQNRRRERSDLPGPQRDVARAGRGRGRDGGGAARGPGERVERARRGARGARVRRGGADARSRALLGALAEELVFTSGGTEANNLAIRGLARGAARGRAAARRLVAARAPGRCWARSRPTAVDVSFVARRRVAASVTPEALRAALRPETRRCSSRSRWPPITSSATRATSRRRWPPSRAPRARCSTRTPCRRRRGARSRSRASTPRRSRRTSWASRRA